MAVQFGQVSCDFVDRAAIHARCRQWLTTDGLHHIVTLNPEMVVLAERDAEFAAAVRAAQLRVPDGAGLFWAQQFLLSAQRSAWQDAAAFFAGGPVLDRITGVWLTQALAKLTAELGRGVYLLGGRREDAHRTAARLQRTFAGLRVHIGPGWSVGDSDTAVLTDIARWKPSVLLVALGAPQQTLWIERNRTRLPGVQVAAGVGGTLATLSGRLPRAPVSWQRANLEWLWRLGLEPRRAKRIWQATVTFPRLMQKYKKAS